MIIKRSLYWDIVKGILIILVIYGHSLQYSCIDISRLWSNPVFKSIYGMHMPLFMLISGYFFYFTVNRHPAKEIFVKRCRQCIVPIITMITLTQIIHLDFSLKNLLFSIIGIQYWFLWAVLVLSLLLLTINKYPPHVGILIGLFLYLTSFAIPVFWISKYIWFMLPFFWTGYYFNHFKVLEKIFTDYLLITTIISGLLYLGLLLFVSEETYIYGSRYTMIGGGGILQAITNLQRTITGFWGAIFLIGFLRLTYTYFNGKLVSVISYFGRNSLQMYVISMFFVFKSVELRLASEDVDYVLAFITLIISIIVTFVATEVLKRFYITNYLFFGVS